METRSSTLAWKIPWTEEPGGLQSMESQGRTQLSTQTLGLSEASTAKSIHEPTFICLGWEQGRGLSRICS